MCFAAFFTNGKANLAKLSNPLPLIFLRRILGEAETYVQTYGGLNATAEEDRKHWVTLCRCAHAHWVLGSHGTTIYAASLLLDLV